MILKNKKVAIIGAGPVGLTTARLLQQKGVDVTVYERDKNAQSRISGGTLDIHNDFGQIALQNAGLLEKFYQNARPTGERNISIDTTILEESMPTEENKYDRPEIDRNDLRKILLESLNENTVIWDSQLIKIEKEEEQYLLHFKSGKSLLADFVIVANGGKSRARKLVTNLEIEYTGTYLIQGEVFEPEINCPNFKKLCGKENTIARADGKLFYCQVKSKGALNYYISFRANENWAEKENMDFNIKKVVLDYLGQILSDWHPTFKELFRATDNFVGLPMQRLYLDKPWKSQNNITLVGDAAHLMPPFAGIGVNIGLLDALNLATNMTDGGFTNTLSAIKDYEQKMFEYAKEAQAQTKMAEDMIHSEMTNGEVQQMRDD